MDYHYRWTSFYELRGQFWCNDSMYDLLKSRAVDTALRQVLKKPFHEPKLSLADSASRVAGLILLWDKFHKNFISLAEAVPGPIQHS